MAAKPSRLGHSCPDLAHLEGSTRFSVATSGPHAETERTERAACGARTRCPPAPERYRSSVGGAHELSGTRAQSWWPADISCEHPVGGPCASGPMKARRADKQSISENRWGFLSMGQTTNAPILHSANISMGGPSGRSSVTTGRTMRAPAGIEGTQSGGPSDFHGDVCPRGRFHCCPQLQGVKHEDARKLQYRRLSTIRACPSTTA